MESKKKYIVFIFIIFLTLILLSIKVFGSSTPIRATIDSSSIDLTVSDSVKIHSTTAQTTITSLSVTNNNAVGVIQMTNLDLKEISPYEIIPFDTDFTRLNMDSHKISVKNETHDFINNYTKIENINPKETLTMQLNAKMSISSIATTEKVAEFIPTFQLDESSIDYNITYNYEFGTPASITYTAVRNWSNYYEEYCIDYGIVDLTDVYKVSQDGLDFGSWELYLDGSLYEKTDYFREIEVKENIRKPVSAKLFDLLLQA